MAIMFTFEFKSLRAEISLLGAQRSRADAGETGEDECMYRSFPLSLSVFKARLGRALNILV